MKPAQNCVDFICSCMPFSGLPKYLPFNPLRTNEIFPKDTFRRLVWSTVDIEGSQAIIKKIVFLSQKIDFLSANSADLDEIQHYAVFYMGLHFLLKYPFRDFWFTKG